MATPAIPDAIPTSLVGSYAQPDWLIDRERLRGRFPPRVRATELWRVDPQYLEQAAGRRDAARDPRPGAGRARHHHGRRGAPRELLEPLRDRPRRRRRRQPRHGARPQRQAEPGAARRRADRAQAPGAGARRRVPAREHEPADQDHRARPVHDVAAGAERRLRRATPSSRWPTPAAVHDEIVDLFAAGADIVQIDEPYMQARPEKAREFGAGGARPRARRRRRARPRCTSASATPRSSTSGPRRTRSCPSSRPAPCDQISIETAQSGLDTSILRDAAGQADHPRRDRPRRPRRGVARDGRRPHPPRAAPQGGRRELVAAPDCGMKYLPRDAAYGKLEALVAGAAMVRSEA